MQNLPVEYFTSARKIAEALGPVYDKALPVDGLKPKFCIGLELGHGLIPMFEIIGLSGEITEVLLEYDLYRRIYCSLCLDPFYSDEHYHSRVSLSLPTTPLPHKPQHHHGVQRLLGSSSPYARKYRSQGMYPQRQSPKYDSPPTSQDLEEFDSEGFKLVQYKKKYNNNYHRGYRRDHRGGRHPTPPGSSPDNLQRGLHIPSIPQP
jgi:hypothetical protein